MKKVILGIIVVILLVLGARYFDKDDNSDPIRIGASLSLTGSAAQFGEMSKLSMEMAVEEINADGGVNGRLVELYIDDDHTVPKDAVSVWRKLVDIDKVDAIFGGMFDFTAKPLYPLALNEEITFISSNFVIEDKFEMNNQSFVMYPDFEKIIVELDSVIADISPSQMGMIRFQSDFGGEIERVIDNILVEQGKSPLVTETYAQIGGTDFRTAILKLKEANVDVVFLDMLDFDIVTFLTRAYEQGYEPQIIGHTTIRDVIGKSDLIDGAIILDWEVPSEDFIKKFEAKYGFKPERGNNKSYDAVYVLADAIANTDDKSEVVEYIESNSFKTINGKFSFLENHSIEKTPVKIMKVVGGELVEVE